MTHRPLPWLVAAPAWSVCAVFMNLGFLWAQPHDDAGEWTPPKIPRWRNLRSSHLPSLQNCSLSLLLFKSLAENEHNLRQKIRSFQWATEVNRLKSWIFVSADYFWSGDGDGNTKKNKVYAKHFMWLLSFISELRTGILFIQKMLNLPILRLH